jgi:rRNA maturation endonuclease Nob1
MTVDAETIEAIARRIVEPLKEQIALIRGDAKEARDGMMKLTTAVEAQDMGHRVESLALEMKQEHSALRQDLVLAITNVKTDAVELTKRVKTLEDAKTKGEGGLLVIRIMKDYGGWFMGLGAAAWAFFNQNKH